MKAEFEIRLSEPVEETAVPGLSWSEAELSTNKQLSIFNSFAEDEIAPPFLVALLPSK